MFSPLAASSCSSVSSSYQLEHWKRLSVRSFGFMCLLPAFQYWGRNEGLCASASPLSCISRLYNMCWVMYITVFCAHIFKFHKWQGVMSCYPRSFIQHYYRFIGL